MAGLYHWGALGAIVNGRDFVLGETVEGIDELIDFDFQGIEIVDVRAFKEFMFGYALPFG